MQCELQAFRAGELSFTEFQRITHRQWVALAQYLMRRWQAPPGVELDDVVQEMLLAAWQFVPKWDPERGTALKRYVVFNACDRAKKWLHQQRNALRRDDSAPSRFPACFTTLIDDDSTEERFLAPTIGSIDFDGETAIDRKRAVARALKLLTSETDRLFLLTLADADGDIDAATRLLFDDARTRMTLRLESEAAVRRALRRAVTRAATAITAA